MQVVKITFSKACILQYSAQKMLCAAAWFFFILMRDCRGAAVGRGTPASDNILYVICYGYIYIYIICIVCARVFFYRMYVYKQHLI